MSDKFLGIPYPIRKNPQGFLYKENGINQIKADLLTLLLTNPGDRVMLPSYGTPLRKLIFEPNTPSLRAKIKTLIVDSIQKWEPRIAVSSIEVTAGVDENSRNSEDDRTALEHVVMIRIIFVDPENLAEVQELKLEVPLSSG